QRGSLWRETGRPTEGCGREEAVAALPPLRAAVPVVLLLRLAASGGGRGRGGSKEVDETRVPLLVPLHRRYGQLLLLLLRCCCCDLGHLLVVLFLRCRGT